MKNSINVHLLRHRSRQLRFERERRRALEETNSILSAYLALLVDRPCGVRIQREAVKGAIGRYRAKVETVGSDYIIVVEREGASEVDVDVGKQI